MAAVQLCESWLRGEPCFSKLMEVALEELWDLEYELEHKFNCEANLPSVWAEGLSRPHPIVENKIVDLILEMAQR